MKKRFLPLSMLLITMVLAQASIVANAADNQGKYTPRTASKATISSFMKSIRANQETGLIDPALLIANQKAVQATSKDDSDWGYLGPDNFGGMTRAIVYENNGNVVIGTIGGDVYRTENGGITFGKVANVGFPISCMVKNSNGDIFIGTGDGRDAMYVSGTPVLDFSTSFAGNGIYKMSGNSIEQIDATAGWAFVNELTIANGKIYAATTDGLMVSTDENGESWAAEPVLEGSFRSVKSNVNNCIVAADEIDVFVSEENDDFAKVTDSLPTNDNPKIIAISPVENVVYIMNIAGSFGSYSTGDLYYSQDAGKSWILAMAGSTLYPILNADASQDGFMIVYPEYSKKILIGSDDLWMLQDADATNVNPNSFRPLKISDYFLEENSSEAMVAWNRYKYLHQGIQNVVFNPNNTNEFFVGTNGGIFKGLYKQDVYSYKGGNRYFITDDEHCSPTRMMNVGIGGGTKVLGGCLDHGTLKMICDTNYNNVTTGVTAFPHITNNDYSTTSSYYTKKYAGGPCAISTINPNVFFVSGTGSLATPIFRTDSDGDDYNKAFEGGGDSPVVTNSDAFRTPFALFENYNDANNPVNTIYAPIRETKYVGDTVYAYSEQSGYPVLHIITETPPNDTAWVKGDTIRDLHDPISTLYVCGVKGKIYMTRDALNFSKATDWLQVSTITGIPTAVAISNDGDMALVGTVDGLLYKVTGFGTTYTSDDLTNLTCTQVYSFDSQAVASIAINPNNKNNVVVTLGNYGNDNYVYRSNDGAVSFTSIQGTLPTGPVYSSLIEKETGNIYVGTEVGIYVRKSGTWSHTGNVTCPVMELKQAVQTNHADIIDVLYDEMGLATEIIYPGVKNEGMIYAATYGNGLIYSAEHYVPFIEGSNTPDDDDNNVVVTETEELNIYPNPVKGNAQIDIVLDDNATVSYVIYDYTGRTVMSDNLGTYVKGTHTLNIKTSELSTGSYIIRVNAGDKKETTKFMVY